jgi:hypothetical protein
MNNNAFQSYLIFAALLINGEFKTSQRVILCPFEYIEYSFYNFFFYYFIFLIF